MKTILFCLSLVLCTVVQAEPVKAAKGHPKAAAAPERERGKAAEQQPNPERESRRADIEYWMSKYDGEEFRRAQSRCTAPRFPALSKQNDEIEVITKRMMAWEDCYNAAIKDLNAASPLTARIPKEVAAVMTKEEMEKATSYLAGVHAGLAEDAKVAAKLVVSDYTVWRDATDAYVAEHNRIVKENKAKGE
ncbi:MAG: hypothetical protein ACLGI6_10650 [Gammaproteobacteria bacterium]